MHALVWLQIAASAAAVLAGYAFAADSADGLEKAHWHDKNIVLVNGKWYKVPEESWGTPHAPYDQRWKSNSSTIIVLIAALRESRLTATIKDAFDKAAQPERIRVGVVQQNEDEDPDCLEQLCMERGKPLERVPGTQGAKSKFTNPLGCVEFDRVRVLRMHASEAAGPVFARGQQPELVEDEDFCMQIDAHTIFKPGWDLALLGEWGAARNEFAVLSTYPTNYKDLYKNSNQHWEMPHICGVTLSHSGAISNHQAGAAANLDRPLIGPVWAAGLSFSRCHAERWVPNDPNLRQIFSGEEFSRAARLWTHGYDFYSITRPTIGVYYGGDKGGKGHWRHNLDEAKRSQERLRTLLKLPGSDQSPAAVSELGRFGLGTRRTLEQYAKFSGVDTQALKAEDKCVVQYVPFDDSGLRERIRREEAELAALFRRGQQGEPKPAGDGAGLGIRGGVIVDAAQGSAVEASQQVHPFAAFLLIGGTLTTFVLVITWAVRAFQRSSIAKGHRAQ